MSESHTDITNAEEHQERQNDAPSSTVTTGMSVHSTSYTSTTLHSTSHRDSTGHDQRPLQAPVSETLPTDMSDTTESDAEKQSVAGMCVFRSRSSWHLVYSLRDRDCQYTTTI